MGYDATDWAVGRATSSDGKTWTKDTSAGEVLSPEDFAEALTGTTGGAVPYIWYEGNRMYFVFEALRSDNKFAIFMAYSDDDGETFTAANSGNAILDVGDASAIAFCDESVANPSIYKVGTDEWLMCLNGKGQTGTYDNNYHLGIAKATTLTGPWTVFPGPILKPSSATGNWTWRVESWRPIPEQLTKGRTEPIEFIYFGNDTSSGISGTEIGHATLAPNYFAWTQSATRASKTDAIANNTQPFKIGEDYDNVDHSPWAYEEVQASNLARSADWLQTQAANWFCPAMVAAGTEEDVSAAELAGAAVAQATAAGSLTSSIALAGATAVIATAGGDLTAHIALTGAALAAALAAGDLTAGGAGAALAGAGAGAATGTGDLTIAIRLAGQAVAAALASADLTDAGAGAALAGAGSGAAAAGGALTTAIPLAGAATASTTGAGGLTTAIPLAGAAASASSAIGSLDLAIALSGAALAEAVAVGGLTTAIRLSGAAVAQASAAGLLAGSAVHQPAPPPRLARAAAETRRLAA
jgi:hypothetical protein